MKGAFLYSGTVSHRRHGNGAHAFTYPVVFAAIDIDRLATAARSLFLGVNRSGLLSIWQRDYLTPGDQPLREKLGRLFAGEGKTLPTGEIVLVTTPRLLGYVFNPVSFFLCHDAESRLVAVVAEVNNTFGERHWYLLTEGRSSPDRPGTCFRADKVFHVSPFFDRVGHYQFRFHRTSDKFVASIELVQANETVLTAILEGAPLPVSPSACVQTLVRHPFAIAMTEPRILWQAAQLYYKRKLPVFYKPPPQSHLTTLRRRPSIRERASTRIVLRFLSRMRHGRLIMTLPDGTECSFGETRSEERV